MTIDLPPELEQYVAEKVGSGAYASASVLIRDCLLLKQDEDRRKLEELRGLIDEAIAEADRGEGEPFDPMATLDEVFARLDAEEAKGK